MRGLVIFDGDDTLWETMPLYDKAKGTFFKQMEEWGFNPSEVRLRFDRVDSDNVKRLGFTRHRFPDSMVRTYQEFCGRAGISPTKAREKRASEIGSSVFLHPSPLLPGARLVLEKLSRAFRLVLFTKGDLEVQHSRVLSSGLGKLFDEVCITPDKNAEMLILLAKRHGQSPTHTWMVGNSLRSDIKPALEAGMRAIWVPYETWIHEEADETVAEAAIRCNSLNELPAVLESEQGEGVA